jgi:hypothetical protein
MTYPPQQPGPYGQQPDPYGQQSGGYGQQPGQYPQQPGHYGQQPGPHGQQPDPYGQPQGGFGYPVGPPPKKNNTGVLVTIIVVAVLVLGGGGIGLYLLLKDDGTGNSAGGGGPVGGTTATAQQVAEQFGTVYRRLATSAFGAVTPDDLDPLVCSADMGPLRDDYQNAEEKNRTSPQTPNVTSLTVTIKDLKTQGDTGTFTLHIEGINTRGEPDSADQDLKLVKENGAWQICGLYQQSGESSTAPTGGR